MNALLSLGYTWLLNRAIARIEARGFEVNVGGWLHEYHPGRPSLACDVMEPFRVPAVIAQGAVRPQDFVAEQNGGFRLQASSFARILHSWEQHIPEQRLEATPTRS